MKNLRRGSAAAATAAIIAAVSVATARAQVVVVTTGKGKHAHAHIVRPKSFATSNAAARRAARGTARQGTASRGTTRAARRGGVSPAGSSQRHGTDLRTVMNQLGLDDTQQKQFADLENAANAGGKAVYDNKTLTPAQAAAEMENVRQKEIDGIDNMLTPAQKTRFHTLLSAADRGK